MAGATSLPWHEEIVAAYCERTEYGGPYDAIAVTFDAEYLRYLDRALEEMCRASRRLPHPRGAARTRLRSAAVDVMMGAFLERRVGDSLNGALGLADAMSGDMENILLGGLLQRLDARGRERLAPIEVLLSRRSAWSLDAEVRRLACDHMAPQDSASYLAQEFDDLRSAFVEAGVLTWLIWQGAVAEEAVPTRETYARLEAEQRECLGRRWLPAPVKRALGRIAPGSATWH